MSNLNGFNQETIRFFQTLRENNSKSWFEKQCSQYEEHVLKPLRNLVDDLGPFMQMLDPQFDVRPQIALFQKFTEIPGSQKIKLCFAIICGLFLGAIKDLCPMKSATILKFVSILFPMGWEYIRLQEN